MGPDNGPKGSQSEEIEQEVSLFNLFNVLVQSFIFGFLDFYFSLLF